MANFVTASFSGGSASPLVHMLVLSKTVSVTLFGARIYVVRACEIERLHGECLAWTCYDL